MRYLLYALLFLVAGATGLLAFSWFKTMSGEEPYGVAFELVDQTGKTFTEKELRAAPAAIFFGFTHCPEVCPTTLFELDGWLKQLGPDGEKIKAYFVSVDPQRDTPEVMNMYVSNVSKRITGVTGDPAKVAAMTKGYNIYVKKIDADDGNYNMDHTASVILLDKGGGFAGTIAYQESAETAVAKLKRLADKS